MAINPVGPNRPQDTSAQQARGAQRGQEAEGVTNGGPAAADVDGADSLNLSETASTVPDAVPAGTLSGDVLQVISQRLASGAYNTPQAADRLAGKLLASGEI